MWQSVAFDLCCKYSITEGLANALSKRCQIHLTVKKSFIPHNTAPEEICILAWGWKLGRSIPRPCPIQLRQGVLAALIQPYSIE